MTSDAVDIVGLGLATIDIMTLVPRLPRQDEVFQARRILLEGGGPVATALVAAARLGATTAYLGPIAPTTWGALTRAGLEARRGGHEPGASAPAESSRRRSSSSTSPRASARSCTTRGELRDLAPEEVPAALIASARALHLDGVHLEAACHAARDGAPGRRRRLL